MIFSAAWIAYRPLAWPALGSRMTGKDLGVIRVFVLTAVVTTWSGLVRLGGERLVDVALRVVEFCPTRTVDSGLDPNRSRV